MTMVRDLKNQCTGCGLCSQKCPFGAIIMKYDEQGFIYPYIDKEKCTGCGWCEAICKKIPLKANRVKEVYGVKNKDQDVLKQSTSGGVFTVISDYILENGGRVYGCILNDKLEAVHVGVSDKEKRNLMRDSKYVQSDIHLTFEQVYKDLENGKKVLFTGTPCQTAAIYKYCENSPNIDNLYICDIICHGVASPGLFKNHLEYIERKNKTKIINIKFRDKELGWNKDNKRRLKFHLKNGDIYYDDLYYKMYFNYNIISRPACSDCQYCKTDRISDFTMGDFWGIDKVFKNYSYKEGVSLLLVRSKKAKELIESVKDKIDIFPAELDAVVKYNPNLKLPSVFNENYNIFWNGYIKHGYLYAVKKYITPNLITRACNKALRIICGKRNK